MTSRMIVVVILFVFVVVKCWSNDGDVMRSRILAGDDWMHAATLDAEGRFHVYWTLEEDDIIFHIVAQTVGYVALGLSKTGKMAGADMVVGWVDGGKVYIQDRYAEAESEPLVDTHQDWELVAGWENGTHTTLTVRRRYNTCDPRDLPITNATMRLLYAHHPEDPQRFPHFSNSPDEDTLSHLEPLRYHGASRGSRSVFLLERFPRATSRQQESQEQLLKWELRNNVSLPPGDDTLYWCKIFKQPPLTQKHHMIKYEPIYTPGSEGFLHHILVYECVGYDDMLEDLSNQPGYRCYDPNMPMLFHTCNSVVVAWAVGSQGLVLPSHTGFPLDPSTGVKYYMMETHYDNPRYAEGVVDNSGVAMYYTPHLRAVDVGVMSIGVDPNWKHLIPPGQERVVSEGHCAGECTRRGLPGRGITMFATILHTHLLGQSVKLRHTRAGSELPPIASDDNYDFNYQEYRLLTKPRKILPEDSLIAECTYNSVGRGSITLGGLSTREEMCLVFGYYYPKVDLTVCYSQPSLRTVLQSLGVQELAPGSNPVKIKSPPSLAGTTLEQRLVSYDWKQHFRHFQDTMRRGSVSLLCRKHGESLFQDGYGSNYFPPNITNTFVETDTCRNRHDRQHKGRRRKNGRRNRVRNRGEWREVERRREETQTEKEEESARRALSNVSPLRLSAAGLVLCLVISVRR